MPYIVALTGGIGSGKTTIANVFQSLGVPIIDADIIAHQVVEKGQPALTRLIDHFGKQFLLPDGNLNRAKLREWIFTHHDDKTWLTEQLHPIINNKIEQLIQKSTAPYVILVSPLLIESGQYRYADRILVADIEIEQQIKRVIARDNIEKDLVLRIINQQISRQQRLTYADDVIENNLTLNELEKKIKQLHQHYLLLSRA